MSSQWALNLTNEGYFQRETLLTEHSSKLVFIFHASTVKRNHSGQTT
jgi:hypothetical protein